MWPFNILFKNGDRKNSSEILEHDIKSIKEKLLSRIADEEKPFIEKGLGKHSEILPVVASIESGLGTFDGSAVGSAEMDPRLFQILTSNKTIISKGIHDLCKGLKSLAGNDIDSIIGYYKKSYSAVSDTISNSINNYGKIEEYLDRQVIHIFRNVNYVAGLLESFKKEIENFQLKHAKMKSLENLINKFEIQLSNRKTLVNRKFLLGKELENLENEKSTIESQMNELINTNDYKEFSKLIGETEVLKQDLDKNRMLFLNYMSVLGKPIKKFMKLADDREVAFEQEKNLSDFLDNQELTRENILLIRAAVEKMGSVMEKLNLKEENRIKTLNRMKEILDGKILNELFEEKLKIENKLEDVEDLINLKGPNKKFELEEKLDKINSNIESAKNDLTIIEKDATGIGRRIEESKHMLEYELEEIFNENVHINVE